MERIRSVYTSMSRGEKRLLTRYFEAFSPKSSENKSVQFLKYLDDCPTISHADMAELLYGNPKAKALSMQKPKIWERMMEILHLSVNSDHRAIAREDPASQIQLEILKELSYALTLRMRGRNDLARTLLEECQQKAESFGYPGLQLQAQTMLRSMAQTREEVTEHYNPLMDLTLESYISDLISQAAMDEYAVMSHLDRMPDEDEISEWLVGICARLEKRVEEHYSRRAHMHLLILKENLCRLQGRFAEGEELVQELKDLMEAHPELGSKYRMGLPYLHLADIELRSYRFPEAKKTAGEAITFFRPGKRIYYRSILLTSLSQIYLGEWDEAWNLLNSLGEFPPSSEVEVMRPITGFLKTCLLYLRGEPAKARHELQQENPLQQDKRGWNVGLRMFEIMVLIDLEQCDAASSRIESFRKYLSRYEIINARSVAIFQYFYHLEKVAFDFSAVLDKGKAALEELKDAPAWNPVGYEIIRFESWLRAHEEGRGVGEVLVEDCESLRKR